MTRLNKKCFSFSRELTPEEISFWNFFFKNFPYYCNNSVALSLDDFSKDNALLEYFVEEIKSLREIAELTDFINGTQFSDKIKSSFVRTVRSFSNSYPDLLQIDLFLLTIYTADIIECSLEFYPNGLEFNFKTPVFDPNTLDYASQLAMI